MRLGNVPLSGWVSFTAVGSFVFVIAEAHDCFGFGLSLFPVEVSGSVVGRIAAEDNESLTSALSQHFRQVSDVATVDGRRRFKKLDGLANGAKRAVDRQHERVSRIGQTIASHD